MSDITNLTSNGVPVFGMITSGKSFFVDPARGSESNTGERMDRALKSVVTAYGLCRDGYNDVVYYLGGSSSPTGIAAGGLTWAKSYTHLVGLGAPTRFSQRSRQFCVGTASTPFMFKVTGTGCQFKNIFMFHGVDDANSLHCGYVSGNRNYFENVHFAGIGHATMDVAGAASLKLDTATENTFKNCTIGLDTIARGADSSEILLDGSSSKNMFEDCRIIGYIDDAAHPLVKAVDARGIEGFTHFKRCLFVATSENNGTDINQVFDVAPSHTTHIVLQDCMAVGVTAWDGTGNSKIYNNAGTPTASAGGGIATVL